MIRRTVDGDGWDEPHTLADGLTGAGSKQLALGGSTGAAAGPQRAMATRSKATWDGMWSGHGWLQRLYLAS